MKETCNVTNKSTGRVVYTIKEDGLRREFYPHETKKNIPVAELEKLVQRSGGRQLFYNCLYIDDREILHYLINGEVAPEYFLTEEKIPNWMNSCSLDEFKDALDFAPEGTKDLIKKYAVSLPLNDYSKREAIKQQLGFDVSKIIENSGEDTAETVPVKPSGRRTSASSIVNDSNDTSAAPARRVVVKQEG